MKYSQDQDVAVDVLGSQRLGTNDLTEESEIRRRTRQMLARSLNTHSVVAYVGSGISIPYGYPSWTDLVDMVIDHTQNILKEHGREISKSTHLLIELLKKQRKGSAKKTAYLTENDHATAVLDSCRREIVRAGLELDKHGPAIAIRKAWDERHKELKEEPDLHPAEDEDPIRVIIERLGIQRFLSLNYDSEIERGWERIYGESDSSLNSIKPYTISELGGEVAIDFAIRATPTQAAVFYAHGRAAKSTISKNTDPLIVTDTDYRDRYTGKNPTAVSYRDGFGLLHHANAILFLGVGLTEHDLLRPIRQIRAQTPEHKPDLPIFALLPSKGDEAQDFRDRALLDIRYGIKVLHYAVPDGDYTAGFMQALKQIAIDRDRWFLAWQKVPSIKYPRFFRPDLPHPTMKLVRFQPPEAPYLRSVVEEVVERPEGISIVVHSQAGCGSHQLANHIAESRSLTEGRTFIASLYLTHDLLTVLEAAAEFFHGGTPRPSQMPLTQHLMSALKQPGNTLILTGADRLLQPEGVYSRDEHTLIQLKLSDQMFAAMHVGTPSGDTEAALFRALRREASSLKSKVVLFTSLVPMTLLEHSEETKGWCVKQKQDRGLGLSPIAQLHRMPNLPADAWCQRLRPLFRDGDGEEAAELIRYLWRKLRGHLASAAHLATYLEQNNRSGARLGDLRKISADLASVHNTRRPLVLISETIRRMHHSDRSMEVRVLEHLGRFTMPTSPFVLQALLDADLAGESTPKVLSILSWLEKRGLAYSVQTATGEIWWTSVTGVRQWAGERLSEVKGPRWSGLPQKFSLPGYSRDPDYERFLSLTGMKTVFESVDLLLAMATDPQYKGEMTQAQAFRGAYDLIRTHLGVSALGRLERRGQLNALQPIYPEYHKRILKLANLLRDHQDAPLLQTIRTEVRSDKRKVTRLHHENAWLHTGELIWLMNELALVPFTAGEIHDTTALFRSSFRVHSIVEAGRRGWRWAREQMFEGALLIERAKLATAFSVVREARTVAELVEANHLVERCNSYLGLCAHLQGRYELAMDYYTRAIEAFEKGRNFRAWSTTLRLRGDLKRHLRDYSGARVDINSAMARATQGRHEDLACLADVSEVLRWASETAQEITSGTELRAQHAILDDAARYAQRLGSHRMLVRIDNARARLQLIGGDITHAWSLALGNLGRTRLHGMRLEFISALALAGEIWPLRRADSNQLLLNAAAQRAENAGYIHCLDRIRKTRASGLDIGSHTS